MKIFSQTNRFIILVIFFYIFHDNPVSGILDEQIELEKNELSHISNIENNSLSEETISNNNNNGSRFLQTDQIRIQFDFSLLQASNAFATSLLSQLTNVFESASLFYQNLLSLKVPISGSIQIPQSMTNCNNYIFSASQKAQSYNNADLLIFVDYQFNSTFVDDFSAVSYICDTDSTNRVMISYLSLTFKNISSSLSDYQFSQLLKQVIHEIMHSLALNTQLINYFRDSTNNLYDASVINITNQTLSYPHTLNWAKKYYNCSSLTSIPIEIDSSGNIHWNRVILLDDIMSGLYIYGEALWSGINNAILQDSGWYNVNLLQYDSQIKWGQNKQCQFVQQGCIGSGYYQEFCNTLNNYGLTFSQNSMGICQQFYSTNSQQYNRAPSNYLQCLFMQPIQNQNCMNTSNQNISQNQYLVSNFSYSFGYQSRAFESTLTPFTIQPVSLYACYSAFCLNNNSLIQITVGSYSFYCDTDTQNISQQTPFDMQGSLLCPSSITDFCQSPGPCQSFCASAGYCLNKKCTCIAGYSGEGCQCVQGYNYYEGQCRQCNQTCLTCNTIDPSQCQTCINGYYLSNGQCLQCGPLCLTCSELAPNQCTSCQEGFFLDATTSTCQRCSQNCVNCTSLSNCNTCQNGYGLNSTNYCSISCMYNCQRCQLDAFNCQQCYQNKVFNSTTSVCECPSSQYEDQYGNCQNCRINCVKCSSITNCFECEDGYKLLPYSQTCINQNIQHFLGFFFMNVILFIFFV
ncbi:hypothetical protein ABPG74_002145 [Tetrahymena malaccensis]